MEGDCGRARLERILPTRLRAKGHWRLAVWLSGFVYSSYSNRGDLTLVDYPVRTTDISFQYGAVQNRTQMVDATGTTTYVYDALDRMTSVTFPGSRSVGYSYSNVGNRASITYPGGSN